MARRGHKSSTILIGLEQTNQRTNAKAVSLVGCVTGCPMTTECPRSRGPRNISHKPYTRSTLPNPWRQNSRCITRLRTDSLRLLRAHTLRRNYSCKQAYQRYNGNQPTTWWKLYTKVTAINTYAGETACGTAVGNIPRATAATVVPVAKSHKLRGGNYPRQ